MSEPEGVAAVEAMKHARGTSAELKLKLINLKAELPDRIIFVFEGDDDRGVYFSWTRYLDVTFRYEPFTCKGKSAVLKLKEAVDRDAGGIGNGVYFFIDRDFDDSRGVRLDDSVYMTDCYSVENYLVGSDVLDEILKIEFHCHGEPLVRSRVLREFDRLYDKFLSETSDVNRELHAARRHGVELEDSLSAGIGRFVEVLLDDVRRLPIDCAHVVRPIRPVTAAEKADLSPQFDALEPRARFRGKFALSFFLKWLELLARDRKSQQADFFKGLDADIRVRHAHLSAVTLGSRSSPPEGFREFFGRIPRAELP